MEEDKLEAQVEACLVDRHSSSNQLLEVGYSEQKLLLQQPAEVSSVVKPSSNSQQPVVSLEEVVKQPRSRLQEDYLVVVEQQHQLPVVVFLVGVQLSQSQLELVSSEAVEQPLQLPVADSLVDNLLLQSQLVDCSEVQLLLQLQ